MKRLATALILFATPAVAETAFLPGYEDLPLPRGFTAPADQRVSFDAPTGRIVEAAIAGPADPAAIAAFYRDALPALGWRPDGAGAWLRDGERLTIAVAPTARGAAAAISIRPARAD